MWDYDAASFVGKRTEGNIIGWFSVGPRCTDKGKFLSRKEESKRFVSPDCVIAHIK